MFQSFVLYTKILFLAQNFLLKFNTKNQWEFVLDSPALEHLKVEENDFYYFLWKV